MYIIDNYLTSPTEHQATPMLHSVSPYQNDPKDSDTWQEGITHVRKNNTLWSGNLQGWIQLRQLISNEAVW